MVVAGDFSPGALQYLIAVAVVVNVANVAMIVVNVAMVVVNVVTVVAAVTKLMI